MPSLEMGWVCVFLKEDTKDDFQHMRSQNVNVYTK